MNIVKQAITGSEENENQKMPYDALVSFYRAFNNKDFALMQANWLQTEEASMSNPLGGIKRGWEEIKMVYQKIFSGEVRVYVEFYDYSIDETENMFIAAGRERGRLETENETIDLNIRTSRVYRRQDNVWKQLHHHGSMDDPKLLAVYQNLIFDKGDVSYDTIK